MKQVFQTTPVGQFPIDWNIRRLKDVAEFSNGKGHEKAIDENGDYIVVNSKFVSTEGDVKKYSNGVCKEGKFSNFYFNWTPLGLNIYLNPNL